MAKGGTTVLMMKALQEFDPGADRLLWAADSFAGLPDPSPSDLAGGHKVAEAQRGQFSHDLATFNWTLWKFRADDAKRLRVLRGWFADTLPAAPVRRVSFLRLDGDLYQSTVDSLQALYDKVRGEKGQGREGRGGGEKVT